MIYVYIWSYIILNFNPCLFVALQSWEKGEVVARKQSLNLAVQTAEKDFTRLSGKFKSSLKLYEQEFLSKDELDRDEIALLKADAQLKKENPGLGATPSEQSNQAMFQTQQNLDLDKYRYDQPTVTRTNKIQGDIGRFMDSKGMQAYTGASKYAVEGARVINNFFDDRAIEDAQADNRNNMVADNLYATNENPMLKRGTWDVNTGTFGSEGQRTVQEGGEMATVDSLLLAKLIAAGADIEIL